jgi:hypothetical protein
VTSVLLGRAQYFSSNLYPYPDHNHQQGSMPPMPTHSMTCAHPCPLILFKLCPCIQKLCNVLPTYTKSWLDWTNKRSFTVVGFSPERLLVSVFLASEKFDSNLELDARMHKIKCATRDMMGNVGAPFSFHHKRMLNLAVVSRFTGNAKLTHAHP